MALKSDGTVVVWDTSKYLEVTVPFGLTDVAQIAASGSVGLALKNDGTVVAMGIAFAANVPVGLNNVVKVVGGLGHALALRSDGTVSTWGTNIYGERNGINLLTGVKDVAAGGYHTLALMSDDSVVAAGENFYGELATPPRESRVIAMAAGRAMTAYLLPPAFPATIGVNRQVGAMTGKITIPAVADHDWTFELSSSNPLVSIPTTVTIATGETSVEFPITAPRVSSPTPVTLAAATDGYADGIANFDLQPFSVVGIVLGSVSSGQIEGGKSGIVTVTLDFLPKTDVWVNLSSNDSHVSPGGSVKVPAGSRRGTGSFLTSQVVTNTTATVTATLGTSSVSAPVTLIPPPAITSVTLERDTAYGNQRIKATVTLATPALSGGTVINITPVNASTSATVEVPAGKTSTTFFVTAGDVDVSSLAQIGVSNATSSQSTEMTVLPNLVKSVTLNPASVTGGTTTTATVRLEAQVGVDTVVDMSTDTGYASVPATLTILAGSNIGTVTVSTVAVTKAKTSRIKASRKGAFKQDNLKINP